jgi:plasmid stabilization system protein ParE
MSSVSCALAMAVVRTTPTADRRILDAANWWWENRTAVPDLFIREFVDAVAKLARAPHVGIPYTYPKVADVRRLLMRRTKYHVYYVYRRERDEVWILSVWRAMRGRGPVLKAP